MFAEQIISHDLVALKRCDTLETAQLLMDENKVKHLPVVDNLKVIGLITESMLLEVSSDTKVDQIMQTDLTPFVIQSTAHYFDVVAKLAEHNLTALAVINFEQTYKGTIKASDIPLMLHQHTAMHQPGATLVLEMPSFNYSLAELSRIAESNDVKILHVLVEPIKSLQNHVLVSLKLNSYNLRYVRQSFERFGYDVVYANNTDELYTDFDERYKWLLKYLND